MQKVIDLKNVKMRSVNRKFVINKRIGRLVPSKEYKDFKSLLEWSVKGCLLPKPYRVCIVMRTYLDIDNPLKAILDSLGKIIEDDRYVLELQVKKVPEKRGKPGSLQVYVESLQKQPVEAVKGDSECDCIEQGDIGA